LAPGLRSRSDYFSGGGESRAVHNFRTTLYFIQGYIHRNGPRVTANSIIEQQVVGEKRSPGVRSPEKICAKACVPQLTEYK
jgi:hypothetical protein